jgi:hypothetical protein
MLSLGLCALALSQSAIAGTVQFDVSDPQITKTGDITLTINGKSYPISVTVGMNAAKKADAIAAQLGSPSVGFTVDHAANSNRVKLPSMPASNTVSFDVGTTGESKDSIRISGSVLMNASVGFNNNNFSPFDNLGNFAVFTAGFSTDVGDLSFSLSSQSLPDTAGVTVADGLFMLLEPLANSYGVDLTLNGDTLSAQFDPALVQNGAGVFFGTTSTSAGVVGSIAAAPEPGSLSLLVVGATLVAVGRARRRKPASGA